jgi:hypothetical protein
MGIVLGFDDGEGDIGLVVEDIVGALGFAAAHQFAAHNDPALGEAEFLADLQHFIPAGLAERWGDEFGADIAFGESALVHGLRGSGWAGRWAGHAAGLAAKIQSHAVRFRHYYYFFNHFPGSILIFADICFFRRYKAEPAY